MTRSVGKVRGGEAAAPRAVDGAAGPSDGDPPAAPAGAHRASRSVGSGDHRLGSAPRPRTLAVLATAVVVRSPTVDAFAVRAMPGSLVQGSVGPLHADLGGNGGGIEEYDDFAGRWVGDAAGPDIGNPEAFLARFRMAGGDIDETALQAYGLAQKLQRGLTAAQGGSTDQEALRARMNTLSEVASDLLGLLCTMPPDRPGQPAVAGIDVSSLTQLDRLLRSSEDGAGRIRHLQRIDRVFADAGPGVALDSTAGRMLAHLAEGILHEIEDGRLLRGEPLAVAGYSMHGAMGPILARYQGLLERQAGLETLSGRHDQATTLLQQCADSVRVARQRLQPDDPVGDVVVLRFEILKSMLLAKSDEAVGALEDLYTSMVAHAERSGDRFPAGLARQEFLAGVEAAYTEFLDDLEKDAVVPSLGHPIARLFLQAQEQGFFDDLPPG